MKSTAQRTCVTELRALPGRWGGRREVRGARRQKRSSARRGRRRVGVVTSSWKGGRWDRIFAAVWQVFGQVDCFFWHFWGFGAL
jgi:hypothetical protein